ncbi:MULTISPECIES: VTT domain-containing protein [Saccharopolyspora]|nr:MULTISPECIES: VTT domain-containing protein [Saccharopolyspora]MCA1189519.1 VTT domain-containing protein [Saccharopolyspora sp. 6T]MCA1195979.1 VTT domain-containing protein [Saccharopolyspora sp. 6V]MCA1228877.1 VTT domain-containing protein [Saccharopolyspora sp. 6M]MCA1282619.1 VTT domain-containing protein [Saccharopolyspora sp. 7B]
MLNAAGTSTLALLPSWLDPENIVSSLGPFALIGVCLIIFAECGLLIGFFLPGDSLLFVTGLFVATGAISTPLWLTCLLLAVCAFVGNVTGYWIGRKVGPTLFNKPDSKLFKAEHVDKTHEFFERYGARAIILARFVPIVRTFITAVAGVGQMDQRKFFAYSAVGAVLWAAGMTVLGFFLGNIPIIKENLEAMAILIVFISIVPIIVEYVRGRRTKAKDAA